MSIECDRCKTELGIGHNVIECVESAIKDEDYTEIDNKSNIPRFCIKCWDEIIEFLLAEGKL
ncbi:MAG: hypothetical protein V1901_04250 [Patescibacteria group bacterium]